MSTTYVSAVSGVPPRLADQGEGPAERRRYLASSPPSRPVSLANPLADAHSGLLLSGSCASCRSHGTVLRTITAQRSAVFLTWTDDVARMPRTQGRPAYIPRGSSPRL
jgi:hypothetical protein